MAKKKHNNKSKKHTQKKQQNDNVKIHIAKEEKLEFLGATDDIIIGAASESSKQNERKLDANVDFTRGTTADIVLDAPEHLKGDDVQQSTGDKYDEVILEPIIKAETTGIVLEAPKHLLEPEKVIEKKYKELTEEPIENAFEKSDKSHSDANTISGIFEAEAKSSQESVYQPVRNTVPITPSSNAYVPPQKTGNNRGPIIIALVSVIILAIILMFSCGNKKDNNQKKTQGVNEVSTGAISTEADTSVSLPGDNIPDGGENTAPSKEDDSNTESKSPEVSQTTQATEGNKETQQQTESIAPTQSSTVESTQVSTEKETQAPTVKPTQAPTVKPTQAPTVKPTQTPTVKPTQVPTVKPTQAPTVKPTQKPKSPISVKVSAGASWGSGNKTVSQWEMTLTNTTSKSYSTCQVVYTVPEGSVIVGSWNCDIEIKGNKLYISPIRTIAANSKNSEIVFQIQSNTKKPLSSSYSINVNGTAYSN